MWTMPTEQIDTGLLFRVLRSGVPASFSEVFSRLADDDDFASWYTSMLAETPFDAFFWEHPALSERNYDDPAEFVVVDSPLLATFHPEPGPFSRQFERHPDADVVRFENLGGDALLIAPCPTDKLAAYVHLAGFLRYGPASQIRSLWRATALTMLNQIGRAPIWLSTCGTGIGWLHVRFDTYPKYYSYGPYRRAT